MKFIVCLTFVFLCAPGFSRSKAVDKREKEGKGIYLERLRHKENHHVTRNEQAQQKSVTVNIGKLGKKLVNCKEVPVPYTGGKMLYVPDEYKRKFLECRMKLPAPVITDSVLNKELFTSELKNVAILYDPQLHTVSKVFKVFNPKMGLKMYQTPTTKFKNENFKGHGLFQGMDKLYHNNGEGLEIGHLIAKRLSTENKTAFSASYSFLNTAPMYKNFNGPIYYQQMERSFLKFVGEAAADQEEVHFMLSVSPNCKMNDQTGLSSIKQLSNLEWLGTPHKGIIIPRSFSVIAYSVPKSGEEKFKVFAWVGNNDKNFPKGYFPNDLVELIPYYECNGDQSSLNGITALVKGSYKMW